ncbi:UNVERIFIED_CONTAM: hypothetical protein HDU68_001498, partial [Siphonaria sp. JEL0065]
MAVGKDIVAVHEGSDELYNPDVIADPAKYMRAVAVVGVWELWSYYLYYNGDNGGAVNGGFSGLMGLMVNNNANANFAAHN